MNHSKFNRSTINNCSVGMLHAMVWFCRVHLQKQPPKVFLKKVFLKILLPETCNFIKKRPQYRCFAVDFAKLLRTPFVTGHFRVTASIFSGFFLAQQTRFSPRFRKLGTFIMWEWGFLSAIWHSLISTITKKDHWNDD